MRRLPAALALTALAALAPAARADPAQDAAQADGPAVYALATGACVAQTQGRLPFTAENAAGLAAAGLRWVRQPPEHLQAVTRIGPGAPSFAQAALPAGSALLTATPGRLCQVTVADAPTGRWIYRSFVATLRAQPGWTLQSRADGFLVTTRRFLRARGPAGPPLDLRLSEFLDGGGPERHTRLIVTLQSF